MTEDEYIIVSNKTAVTSAIDCLRHVLGGDNWGVSDEEVSKVMGGLYDMKDNLFKAAKIGEE